MLDAQRGKEENCKGGIRILCGGNFITGPKGHDCIPYTLLAISLVSTITVVYFLLCEKNLSIIPNHILIVAYISAIIFGVLTLTL